MGGASIEASILTDELLQVSLSDQILDLSFQIVAVLGLVPNISVVGTIEAGVPLTLLPRISGGIRPRWFYLITARM